MSLKSQSHMPVEMVDFFVQQFKDALEHCAVPVSQMKSIETIPMYKGQWFKITLERYS